MAATEADLAAISTALEWALIGEEVNPEREAMIKALAKTRNALGAKPRETFAGVRAWADAARAIYQEISAMTTQSQASPDTDIVDQLRHFDRDARDRALDEMCCEAADEIERLRAIIRTARAASSVGMEQR